MTARASHRRRLDELVQRLHGLQRLLQQRLRVKRIGINLHVVLGAADALPEPIEPTPSGSAEFACMRADLAQWLDVHPGARSLFPSLVLVEHALGDGALDCLPDAVVADASTLLTKLAGDRSADGVGMLRTRLRLLRSAQCDPQRAARAAGCLPVEGGGSSTTFMPAERERDRRAGRLPPATVAGAGTDRPS